MSTWKHSECYGLFTYTEMDSDPCPQNGYSSHLGTRICLLFCTAWIFVHCTTDTKDQSRGVSLWIGIQTCVRLRVCEQLITGLTDITFQPCTKSKLMTMRNLYINIILQCSNLKQHIAQVCTPDLLPANVVGLKLFCERSKFRGGTVLPCCDRSQTMSLR